MCCLCVGLCLSFTSVLQFEDQCLLFMVVHYFNTARSWIHVEFWNVMKSFIIVAATKICENPRSLILVMNYLLHAEDHVWFGFLHKGDNLHLYACCIIAL